MNLKTKILKIYCKSKKLMIFLLIYKSFKTLSSRKLVLFAAKHDKNT